MTGNKVKGVIYKKAGLGKSCRHQSGHDENGGPTERGERSPRGHREDRKGSDPEAQGSMLIYSMTSNV
jgi:hypothetical protein